jgi:hypothetical protein
MVLDKGKAHPVIRHEGTEWEYRYGSTVSVASAIDDGGWLTPNSARCIPGCDPGTYCIGGRVGPRAGLDGCGKFSCTGILSPDHPARSNYAILARERH